MSNLPDYRQRPQGLILRNVSNEIHIDVLLLLGLLILLGVGLMVLFSASGQNIELLIRQLVRAGTAFIGLLFLAQIHPDRMRNLAYWVYGSSLVLLVAVLVFGHEGKGAQRWLYLLFFQFQPSELMKLAVPLVMSAYLTERPLPPTVSQLVIGLLMIVIPSFLIAKQPDLGTSLLIASSGLIVLFLSGIRWKIILGLIMLCSSSLPILWYIMHSYQRQRVLTFLDPEHIDSSSEQRSLHYQRYAQLALPPHHYLIG